MKYYVGIDLGGTNIVAGVVDETYRILAKASCKTNLPRPADAIADDMASMVLQAVGKSGLSMNQIENVGLGTPGTANKKTGVIEYSNNLRFEDVPIRAMMEQRLNKKIYIENDANAAAFGEYLAGAGKDVGSMVAITLGTGVGGGVIIDGRILTGFSYAGAELGHTVIVAHGRACTCGRKGCFEAYSSATGLINLTKEMMDAHPESKMWEISQKEGKVSGRTAFDAMRLGDKIARETVDEYIEYLGIGVANMINIFQPHVLCIGGGICHEGETLLAPLREKVYPQTYARKPENRTRIVAATLGNDAGVIGAAMLSLEAE